MKNVHLSRGEPFRLSISLPGDKSISHRAVIFASIAKGVSTIRNFSGGKDNWSTVGAFRSLGIPIDAPDNTTLIIQGNGRYGFTAASDTIDCGNSGTTMRLMMGLLAAQPFRSMLDGDESLRRRPMNRVISPLKLMGARLKALRENNFAPIQIESCEKLQGIHYPMPIASAQVKSAILLAGLYAENETIVEEKEASRDHTELMLKEWGYSVSMSTGKIVLRRPLSDVPGREITIPGDPSSAAFFIALTLLTPLSSLIIENIGVNPTRTGFIEAVRRMGGNIELENERFSGGERVADIRVSSSALHGIDLCGADIPRTIDEIPMLAVLAAFADGATTIRDAHELRVKETDRIHALCSGLKAFGAPVTENQDGLIIHGGSPLIPGEVESFDDHRIAMAFAIGAARIEGESMIKNVSCVDISFPDFFRLLEAFHVPMKSLSQ